MQISWRQRLLRALGTHPCLEHLDRAEYCCESDWVFPSSDRAAMALFVSHLILAVVKRNSCCAAEILSTVLLKFPITIIQRTDLTSLEPSRDAVEVKSVL